MLNRIKNLLAPSEGQGDSHLERIQVATCVLLLEMAHSDEEFQDVEKRIIEDVLQDRFQLSSESVAELMTFSQQERQKSFDLHQFAREINDNFSIEEKEEILETLWRIIYADGVLDKYEDHLIRKLTTLLRLSHRQMIDVKLKVKESTGS